MHQKHEDSINHRRLALKIGALIGGVLSLTVSFMMDHMASGNLQGTWRDAIVQDLETYMSITISPDSIQAYALFLLVILLMAMVGALMGAFFSYSVSRFLEILSS